MDDGSVYILNNGTLECSDYVTVEVDDTLATEWFEIISKYKGLMGELRLICDRVENDS